MSKDATGPAPRLDHVTGPGQRPTNCATNPAYVQTMDQNKSQRVSKRPFRWMLVFLLALAIGVVVAVLWFKFWPESLVESPAAPKPPMHNAPG
jgi:hypothetical protein